MHYRTFICPFLLALTMAVHATALNQEQVSPDAKWLLHVDLENLRKTKAGDFLLNRFLAQQIAQVTNQLKFDVSNLFQKITSVTAYGTDFKKGPQADGVLLINADTETQKALEGVLVAQILADTNGPVKKLEHDSMALYSIANEIFVSPDKGGVVIVSKSQHQIEQARDLMAGKKASGSSNKLFTNFPNASKSFFFLGAAAAFTDAGGLPAQAKILQTADGGGLVLGEDADQLFLNLTLRAKTPEVAKQIQQVIEGMAALVSLGQIENQDLLQLAKSAKVSSTAELVSVNVDYPVAKVLALLSPETPPKKAKAKHARRTPKPKPAVEPSAKEENP
jgi:hypothetical protein